MQIKGKLVELGESDGGMGPMVAVFGDDCITSRFPVSQSDARALAPLLYKKVVVNFEIVEDLDAK